MKKVLLYSLGSLLLVICLLTSSCKKDDYSPEQEKLNAIKDKIHLTFKLNGESVDLSRQCLYSIYTDGSLQMEVHDSIYTFRIVVLDPNNINNLSRKGYEINFSQKKGFSNNNDTAWHLNVLEYNAAKEYITGTFEANKLKNFDKNESFSITEGSFFVGREELRYAE